MAADVNVIDGQARLPTLHQPGTASYDYDYDYDDYYYSSMRV